MILQTDKGLCEAINKWGCNFRSLLAISEEVESKQLTVAAIQQAYDELTKIAMNENCLVHDPDAIIRWGFKALLSSKKGRQIGQIFGRFNFWGWTNIYSVLKGQTANGYHFRLGDNNGRVIFDPYPGVVILTEYSALIYQVT